MAVINGAEMKIDGKAFPKYPTKWDTTLADLDKNSTRTANGTLKRTRVRGAKTAIRSIDVEFNTLSQSQMQTILRMVENASVQVTYLDPAYGVRTAKMYVSDRKASVYSYNESLKQFTYESLSFTLTEY